MNVYIIVDLICFHLLFVCDDFFVIIVYTDSIEYFPHPLVVDKDSRCL